MEAILRVKTEGGAEARAAIEGLDNAIGRSRTRRTRASAEAASQELGNYRKSAQGIIRESQLVTRAKLRELALEGDAQKRFIGLYTEMHRRATAALEAEIGKRGELTQRERRQAEDLAIAMVNEHDRAERAKTAASAREGSKREKLQRELAARISHAIGAVGSAAAGFAGDVHGRIQDARTSRAQGERNLGNAVRNSGGSTDDVRAARARVNRFVDQTGMSYDTVASALELGQGRGSALEAGEGRTREQAMEAALTTIREANAEGIDPGQLLAARGRLGAAGLKGDALNTALRYTMLAAQHGSVEVDQIISQGLPGASSLMTQRAAALGPGASEEARQRARLDAFRESVAVQEVAASAGRQPGNTANTVANLNNFLRTPRRQEMILHNIQTAESQINTSTPEGQARAARLHALYTGEGAMFEADPTRRGHAMRLRDGIDPLQFAARLTQAAGNGSAGAMNLLAGSGQGNAQSLLANQRSLLTFIASELERVHTTMSGGGVQDATIEAHQRDVENDALSQLTRSQERAHTALTDNTSRLVQLSNQLAQWQTEHPIANAAAGQGKDLLTMALGATALPGAGRALAGAPALAKRAGAALLNTRGGQAAAGLAGAAAIPAAAVAAALSSVQVARELVTGRDLSGHRMNASETASAALSTVNPIAMLGRVSAEMAMTLVRELRANPLQATVTQQNDVHNATVNAGRGQGAR